MKSAACYFLALLSKENAITWLAVFPLALYVFQHATARNAFKAIVPHGIATLLYLAILAGIQGGSLVTDSELLTNNVLAGAGVNDAPQDQSGCDERFCGGLIAAKDLMRRKP